MLSHSVMGDASQPIPKPSCFRVEIPARFRGGQKRVLKEIANGRFIVSDQFHQERPDSVTELIAERVPCADVSLAESAHNLRFGEA